MANVVFTGNSFLKARQTSFAAYLSTPTEVPFPQVPCSALACSRLSEDVPEDEKSEAWGSQAAPSRKASIDESSSWAAAAPTRPRG